MFNDPDSILWNWTEFRTGAWYVKLQYILLFPLIPLFRWVGFKIMGKR